MNNPRLTPGECLALSLAFLLAFALFAMDRRDLDGDQYGEGGGFVEPSAPALDKLLMVAMMLIAVPLVAWWVGAWVVGVVEGRL